MALILTPPPKRDGSSQISWPDGEPKKVRDAYDAKTGA